MVATGADLPATIVHNLARGRVRFADRRLLAEAETGGWLTYEQFAALVEGAARRLRAEGLRRGDRLAVCLRNGIDAAVALWACARGGYVLAGLPWSLAPAQWAYMLTLTQPVLVLAGDEFLPALRAAAPGADVRPVGDHLTGSSVAWDDELPLPDPGDVYAVIFTSGTTGRPKAAMLTGRMTMSVAGFYVDALGLTAADRTAIHLPFYYLSGHVSQLNPVLLVGGSAVTMADFSPAGLLAVVRQHEVTLLDVVPSIFAMLLRESGFRAQQLPSLRTAFYGGAPMPTATVAALRGRLPQLRLFDVYGMSETGGTIACLTDGEQEVHAGSVGRPVRAAEVRVVDDEGGGPVGAGAVGELLVRGPMVTPGYWGDPAATAAALTDGWLRTGDLGRFDEAGYLYVVDRKKDMIIRGGVKVYPAEVEAALLRHPEVVEAAVVGVFDRVAYEAVAAFVVGAPGAGLSVEQVRRWVRDGVGAAAVPRVVRLVPALPRNRTGKVDKVALRARLQ